jgi:NTP pyrophosphatase (non-canonical NTP hydrolase)
MNFKKYIEFTRKTAIYPKDNPTVALSYVTLGLISEAGEIAGVFKKCIRDNNSEVTPEVLEKFKKELGDVMWYVARLSDELGIDLEEVLKLNESKLSSRQERNQLGGSGDDR